jgi:hypothetical protein
MICCKDDCGIERNCIEKVLIENEMTAYTGEEIACNFHLSLYDLRGQQYFLLKSHCADMVSYPFDCDGNKLCESGESHTCTDFYENANYIGIVGIRLN